MAETNTGVDLSFMKKLPPEDLQAMVDSIRNGATTPAEGMGFDAPSLNNIEQIAVALYRGKKFREASMVFYFLLTMDRHRASAWRGLGACAYVRKEISIAALCYGLALNDDPEDLMAAVYLGESLCAIGDREQGLKVLETAVRKAGKKPEWKPFVLRARAILAAGGGVPERVLLPPKALAAAEAAARAAGLPEYPYEDEQPLTIGNMKANPKIAAAVKDLAQLAKSGRVNLAQVGGVTEKELDGAYAGAVKLLEAKQYDHALTMVGYLMLIHPYQARYYQLAAICFQRIKQWGPAADYYANALAFAPDDPRSLVFRGECLIQLGLVDEGVASIKQGVQSAGTKAEHDEVAKRGKTLIKQFGR